MLLINTQYNQIFYLMENDHPCLHSLMQTWERESLGEFDSTCTVLY